MIVKFSPLSGAVTSSSDFSGVMTLKSPLLRNSSAIKVTRSFIAPSKAVLFSVIKPFSSRLSTLYSLPLYSRRSPTDSSGVFFSGASSGSFVRSKLSIKWNDISISPLSSLEVSSPPSKVQFFARSNSMWRSLPVGSPFSSSLREVKSTVLTPVTIRRSPIHSGRRWSVISNIIPGLIAFLS